MSDTPSSEPVCVYCGSSGFLVDIGDGMRCAGGCAEGLAATGIEIASHDAPVIDIDGDDTPTEDAVRSMRIVPPTGDQLTEERDLGGQMARMVVVDITPSTPGVVRYLREMYVDRFMNAYAVDREYGGPEQGGWWFESGQPLASIPFGTDDEGEAARAALVARFADDYHDDHPRTSVGGTTDFEVGEEDHFALAYPTRRPQYE